MSRNSKSARLISQRGSFKKARWDASSHQSVSTGNRGPSETQPKHGKKRAWFQLYDSHGDYVKSQQKGGRRHRKESDDDSEARAVVPVTTKA